VLTDAIRYLPGKTGCEGNGILEPSFKGVLLPFLITGERFIMVNVYDEDGEIIAEVKYNSNLDYWDGRNMTSGSTGRHKGITRLKDGRYVLINGTQWQGEKDHAGIITPEMALQEILRSGNTGLLDEEKFKELKELQNDALIEEA